MMPVYRYMDSYPPQMSPPWFESNPRQMRMDLPMPMPCEYHWSPGFYIPCHQCCSHGNFPAYNGFRPYYLPQPPQYPCCGNYFTFHPVHHPPHYSIPPPHYSVDHSKYEYDKDAARDHCFGCSNHVCDRKNDESRRIEEQESGVEKDNSCKVVDPVLSANIPYPVGRIPSARESIRNQEHRSPFRSEPQSPAPLLHNKERKNVQNGQNFWFPFDIDKLKSVSESQDVEEVQKQQSEAESGQVPFPVFWLPLHGKPQEDGKQGDIGASQRHNDAGLPDLRVVPLKGHEGDDQPPVVEPEESKEIAERGGSSRMEEKNIQRKIIPVKQAEDEGQKLEEPSERDSKDKAEHEGCFEMEEKSTPKKTIPVKQSEDARQVLRESTEKASEDQGIKNSQRKHSSSPPKPSKLRPVCLRVDPLPKKKNCLGSSRSPSPPARKEDLAGTSKDHSDLPTLSKSEAGDSNKEVTKTIPLVEDAENGLNSKKEGRDVHSIPDKDAVEGAEAVRLEGKDESRDDPVRKSLSDEEAAAIIQSAYHGYEVRRCEPLKKLKQMVEVREQMVDIKNRIQAIEASTDSRDNEKEITVIEEMAMSLLLRLDAIQGLHPSIRDVRKSLASELMSLQEKLDNVKKRRVMAGKLAITEQVETSNKETAGDRNSAEKLVDDRTPETGNNQSNSKEVSKSVSSPWFPSEQQAAAEEEEYQVFDGLKTCEGADDPAATETRDTASRHEFVAKAVVSVKEEDQAAVEAVPSVHPPSPDERATTAACDEKNGNDLELVNELLQDVEVNEQPTLGGSSTPELSDQGDEVRHAEVEANASTSTNDMAEDVAILPSGKDANLSETPIGVIDEDRQDSLLCTPELSANILVQQPPQETETREQPMAGFAVDPTSDKAPNSEPGLQEREETHNAKHELTATKQGLEAVEGHDAVPADIVDSTGESAIADGSAGESETESHGTHVGKVTDHPFDHLGSTDQKDRMAENSQSRQVEENGKVKPEEEAKQNKKLIEENQRLRETMEKLMAAGREQLQVISSLTGKVKNLEKKLSERKKVQVARRRRCSKRIKNASERKHATVEM